jgi:hypothetical protein
MALQNVGGSTLMENWETMWLETKKFLTPFLGSPLECNLSLQEVKILVPWSMEEFNAGEITLMDS